MFPMFMLRLPPQTSLHVSVPSPIFLYCSHHYLQSPLKLVPLFNLLEMILLLPPLSMITIIQLETHKTNVHFQYQFTLDSTKCVSYLHTRMVNKEIQREGEKNLLQLEAKKELRHVSTTHCEWKFGGIDEIEGNVLRRVEKQPQHYERDMTLQ